MTNSRYWPQEAPPLKTANTAPPNAMEKHFTLEQIAEAWGISVRCARRIFRDVPGVADVTAHRKSLTARSYQVLRVPASVAERVHANRAAGFTLKRKGK